MSKRVIVVGAGPMGLEAALGALERGFEVSVLEAEGVGANLRRWGPTRFFTPFRMNVSARMRALLGGDGPPEDALLTGPEMADVLKRLAARPPLAGRVFPRHRVVAVARGRLIRRDLPRHPLRAAKPFRLLVETAEGEQVREADCVLDASGTYQQPAAIGAGGIPAPGERLLNGHLVRHLGTLHDRLDALSDKDVLVVGHGHSAATAVLALAQLPKPPRVTWAVRTPNRRPCVEVAGDPLPERDRVASAANALASAPPQFLRVERRATVEGLRRDDGKVEVALSGGRNGCFDAVVGLTGYRPDLSFLSELALEVAPESEGALRLARALAGVTDCLSVPRVAAEDLASGEPGFHLVGAKSYGRLSTFLLSTGLGHLEAILDGLAAQP